MLSVAMPEGTYHAHPSTGIEQSPVTLSEDGVRVDIANPAQRVSPSVADQCAFGVCSAYCLPERGEQRCVRMLQSSNHATASGRIWRARNLWMACCEPLSFLKLNSLPRRIAKHDIKSPGPAGTLVLGRFILTRKPEDVWEC